MTNSIRLVSPNQSFVNVVKSEMTGAGIKVNIRKFQRKLRFVLPDWTPEKDAALQSVVRDCGLGLVNVVGESFTDSNWRFARSMSPCKTRAEWFVYVRIDD